MKLKLQTATPVGSAPLTRQSISPDERAPKVSGPSWSLSNSLRLLVLALVLPNLITCAKFSAFSSFFRGWINIEFLIITAAYLVTRHPTFLFCIAVEFLLDLFEPIAHIYYFNSGDALEALGYLDMVPFWHLVIYALLVVAYVALSTASVRLLMPRLRRRGGIGAAVMLLFTAGLLFGLDCSFGRYQTFGADMTQIRVSAGRTPILSTSYRAFLLLRPRPTVPPQDTLSAAKELFNGSPLPFIASRTNLVLILVESWGKLADPAAQGVLERAYKTAELRARYTVQTGSVPFRGATIYGETRALCGQYYSNGIDRATADDLRGCLPNVFAAHGYSTVGIHGFHARMYDRRHWYPRIGFSTVLFKEDLDRLGMKTCPGGLVGTCDTAVAQLIADKLLHSSTSHPLFLHWMTLNSHLPVTNDVSENEEQYCQTTSPVFQDRALCSWQTLVERVHQSVSRIALTQSLPPTAFVIVGDHAPPFSASARRAEFSQKEVPYILLIPKAESANSIARR